MAGADLGEEMRHFFLDEYGDKALINDPVDIHHITKVLRMKVGDRITVAHKGVCFYASFLDIKRDSIELEIHDRIDSLAYPKIHLYQALAKGQKIEFILQHCTELGVMAFSLFPSRYSDIRDVSKKRSRYERIIKDAAKQSRASDLPMLAFYNNINELELEEDNIFLCYEGENHQKISIDKPGSVAIIIGPEGGFNPQEVEYLAGKVKIVSLGSRILRTETAGIVATSLVLREFGLL